MSLTVAALYTSPAIVGSVSALFEEVLPEVRLVNVVDSSLIQDVIAANEVTKAVERRLLHYYMACEHMNATVVLNTCSSIGEATTRVANYISLPIINIDTAMAHEAVAKAGRIAVLATLPTTLGPTMRLVERSAKNASKKVEVVDGLAEGAFDALLAGDSDKHDRILAETANRVADKADLIVLAQGSMARMEAELESQTGKPVLASPRRGVEFLKRFLEEKTQ